MQDTDRRRWSDSSVVQFSVNERTFKESEVLVEGQKKAREMWFLCRLYSAQEALKMGLINAVGHSSRSPSLQQVHA